MPILRPCAHPGCPELLPLGTDARCEKHKRQYNRERSQNVNQSFYNSTQWKRLRAVVRKEEPICSECKKHGRVSLTQHVDHILPIAEGGAKLARENLAGLCESCHNAKTRRENQRPSTPGGGGRQLQAVFTRQRALSRL